MSDMSRAARRAMRAKIHRLTQPTSGKVDASDYGPEEVLDAGIKTGMRPISRRAFKKGGKVVAMEGKDAAKHAGKKPRKTGNEPLNINSIINRNVKDANEEREGIKHVGGFKRGGRTKKAMGGAEDAGVPTTRFNFSPVQKSKAAQMAGLLKTGGRAKKASGGFDDPDGGGPLPPRPQPPRPKPRPDPDTLGMPRKHGGKADKFEGTAKDVREDKKLAKKHHMSMKDWEASSMDAKHDKQRSMKGLKSGGLAMDGEYQGTRPTGGRLARKDGGKNWIAGAIKHPGALRKALHVKEGETIPAKKLEKAEHSDNPKLAKRARLAETLKRINKRDGGSLAGLELATGGRAKHKSNGKTDINIVISTGKGQQPIPGGLGGAGPVGMPIPVPPASAGAGAPMAAPMPSPQAAAGALGGGSPVPLNRKRGGRTYRSYKDMDAGAGSGEGRLEKTEIQKHKK